MFMVKGYREQRVNFYNAGIGLFVVLIVFRYFDTFWYLMPRSVFFMLGGLFLIGWALFIDRQKKQLERAADQPPKSEQSRAAGEGPLECREGEKL